MKLIAEDELLSIAKDVTLANGAKHRCIDATQIHELPKTEVVRCKDCKHYDSETQSCLDGLDGIFQPDWFCADGTRKDGDGDG